MPFNQNELGVAATLWSVRSRRGDHVIGGTLTVRLLDPVGCKKFQITPLIGPDI